MANNIGCRKSQNKTRLIDPNDFEGHNSISNIAVPLEDLSILVELTTTKKARTLLTTTANGIGSSSSRDQVTVNFIEGSNVSGKKVLTTKFTDLTTTFDDYNDGENLGITGIDIDFNSQHAPMINIHFVDVRGSAIFQNEDRINGSSNKYSVFFQLPYPLYELTIKGYYGQPVKYCLHMTKFTSRFNSKTGNFEITGSFIGYSYAMLSDMLLGYLKAIEYTTIGADYYTQLKKISPNLLTLNELMVAISNINSTTKRILSSDKNYQQLLIGDSKREQLTHIESLIQGLGQTIDLKKDLSVYEYFIVDKSKDISSIIEDYNLKIKDYIDSVYNDNNDILINSNDFIVNKLTNDKVTTDILSKKSISGVDTDTQTSLYSYTTSTTSGYGFSKDYEFDVYDNRKKYTIINETRNKINNQQKVLKLELAKVLKLNIREGIGFDPTVRNIINVFTTAVEVFLHVLYEVSRKADDPSNASRINELKSVFKVADNSDITNKALTNTSLTPKFYPWPDYRKEDQRFGYQEEYLGNAEGLKNPKAITELDFIDDLLAAFLTQAAKAKNSDVLLINSERNWFPVNPLDTRLFIDKFPYKRISGIDKDEIVLLSLLRAILFLGYTNDKLSKDEIINMANAEADSLIKDITTENVLQAISNLNEGNFLQANGYINGFKTPVLANLDKDNYYYNYIFQSKKANDLKLLPINGNFQGTWNSELSKLVEQREIDNDIFISNYNTTQILDVNDNPIQKPDDGGIYLRIISAEDYNDTGNYKFDLINDNSINTSTFKLIDLKTPVEDFKTKENIGFNAMGGTYGIQEYRFLDYGSDIETKSYRFVFYDNGNGGSETYNKSNGLGLKRGTQPNGIKTLSKTPFDFGVSFQPIPVIGDYANTIDGQTAYLSQNNNSGHYSTNLHKNLGNNLILAGKAENSDPTITYPYINFYVYYKIGGSNSGTVNPNNGNLNNLAPISLFGSRLYYEQTDNKSKALLFLHTFPWRGLTNIKESDKAGIFNINEIINTFSRRGGFISTPKIWVAFIGAMLWRASSDTDPIKFYSGTEANTGESYIPNFSDNTASYHYPNKYQYLTAKKLFKETPTAPMFFMNEGLTSDNNYVKLDQILLTLPTQAKNTFIKTFFEFVDSDFAKLQKELEIFNGTSSTWKSTYNAVINSITLDNNGKKSINGASISGPYSNTNSYSIISPISDDNNFWYNYFLEIKDNSSAANILVDLFVKKEVYIANSTYRIWKRNNSIVDEARDAIRIPKTDLKLYLDTIIGKLNKNKESLVNQNKTKQTQQNLFGTSDETVIKFMLYKTCKNVYDKWVGGASSSENIIFRCGGRNDVDTELAINRGLASPKLIDSFRFVTRSFRDIGDELAINPIPVLEYLRNNPNTSFYDVVTSLLSANYFNFTALPSFINYRDPDLLESVFNPIPNSQVEVISNSKTKGNSCGPSFVCVYLGESSKHLDFNDSQYGNDGFDVRCDNGTLNGLPKDFTNDLVPYEDVVTFFSVNYGQQNQNIFKDVSLDQSEFGETAESLQIIDDISRKGSETHRTLAGQNIYNVYSVRSYKVEVEMLGNAMIQPMMYFQLNNIPMFHGAYMITRVRHSIKPNHMSTIFTGVRIRKPETKIFDTGDLFMSLLDTIDNVNIDITNASPFGTVYPPEPPIVITIIDNGGTNGNIISGNIKTKPVQVPKGILKNITDTDLLINEASDSLNLMLNDWVSWMKINGFNGNNGNYAAIISAFRSYQQQQEIKERLTKANLASFAATPGNSRHGWGIAVDFQFYKKDGTPINNYLINGKGPNLNEGFNYEINQSLTWLVDNSYTYGWILPVELRNGKPPEEFWHFEYHGKSAACLLAKNPDIKGRTIDTNQPYKLIVKNPLDINNKEAVYEKCDFKEPKIGSDGTNDINQPAKPNPIIGDVSEFDNSFYRGILQGIGAPLSSENMKFFYAWRQAEGGKAAFNPFNTTQIVGNTTNYNCIYFNGQTTSVRNYANADDGISATIKTLQNGYYTKLVNGLINNIGAEALSKLSDLDTWGTHRGVNKVLAVGKINPPPISITTVTKKDC